MDWITRSIHRRIKIAFFILSGYLLVSGAARMYEGIKYGQRHIMRYEDFIKKHPQEGWYRITGGMMNALEQSHEVKEVKEGIARKTLSGGEMEEYFVPLRSKKVYNGQSQDLTTYLIAQTQEPSLVGAVHAAYSDLGDAPTLEEMNQYAGKNGKQIFVQRDVEGMIRASNYVNLPSTRTEFYPQKRNLSPNFVVIEERGKPDPFLGFVMILLGAALLAGQWWYYIHHIGMDED